MRPPIIIVLIAILSGVFALPTPAHRHPVGQVVRVKPKDMTPVHAMGNAEGLKNNHHGVVLGHDANGMVRVAHISSNPPGPKVHVKSVVKSVNFYGQMHVGRTHVHPDRVKPSNQFPNKRLTPDEVAKIKLASQKHAVAHDAARAGRSRLRRTPPAPARARHR